MPLLFQLGVRVTGQPCGLQAWAQSRLTLMRMLYTASRSVAQSAHRGERLCQQAVAALAHRQQHGRLAVERPWRFLACPRFAAPASTQTLRLQGPEAALTWAEGWTVHDAVGQ